MKKPNPSKYNMYLHDFSIFRSKVLEQQPQMLDMLLEQLLDVWLEFLFWKIKLLKIGNLFSNGLLLEYLDYCLLHSWFGTLQDQIGLILNVGMIHACKKLLQNA